MAEPDSNDVTEMTYGELLTYLELEQKAVACFAEQLEKMGHQGCEAARSAQKPWTILQNRLDIGLGNVYAALVDLIQNVSPLLNGMVNRYDGKMLRCAEKECPPALHYAQVMTPKDSGDGQ